MDKHLSQAIKRNEWEKRDDWRAFLIFDSDLAHQWGWECRCCRPSVGWPKTTIIELEYGEKIDAVRVHIECGHCGLEHDYNAEGELLDEYE